MQEVTEIPIEKIKVGEHDQRLQVDDESLDGLAASIGRIGLVYALIVHPVDDGYILVEGHRRLAACRRMGFKTVRCHIEDSGRDRVAEIAFAGNFFRKDLTPVELASAIKEVLDKGTMDVKELAAGFHRSEHWVNSMIAICDWPADVQCAIHETGLSVSAASNLACVTDDIYRSFLLQNAVDQGATARTTAAWLQAWRSNMPQTEAVREGPVAGRQPQQPLIPQAPCFICGQVFPVNQMSHVPMCGTCIGTIRAQM